MYLPIVCWSDETCGHTALVLVFIDVDSRMAPIFLTVVLPFQDMLGLRSAQLMESVAQQVASIKSKTKMGHALGEQSWKHELVEDASLETILSHGKTSFAHVKGTALREEVEKLNQAHGQRVRLTE